MMVDPIELRTANLNKELEDANYARTSRIFAILMAAQWAFAILVSLVYSPYAWEGDVRALHTHVYVAVLLGGALSGLPIFLALTRPTAVLTRHVIAVAQMLWSAVLIHLTGGRIETHFHVFGSLAFVAFYRDWKVLVPATVVVAADHLIRQIMWPQSVYGIVNPEWWRFLEHAFWVVFEDIVLIAGCLLAVREMRAVARARAEVEASQAQLVRTGKLAAVGQLAAIVGHELRNPLTAIRSASEYVARKLRQGETEGGDPRVVQFLGIMDREIDACSKIIGELLDFARERPLQHAPCPLAELATEAIAILPPTEVTIENTIAFDLPTPSLDRDQFRQVLVNLTQNAVEAVEARGDGRVVVHAEQVGTGGWLLSVTDNGPGVPAEAVAQIFEPLHTTKSKGTGLGLAIVANIVKRHDGTIRVAQGPGGGASFVIEWREAL